MNFVKIAKMLNDLSESVEGVSLDEAKKEIFAVRSQFENRNDDHAIAVIRYCHMLISQAVAREFPKADQEELMVLIEMNSK